MWFLRKVLARGCLPEEAEEKRPNSSEHRDRTLALHRMEAGRLAMFMLARSVRFSLDLGESSALRHHW